MNTKWDGRWDEVIIVSVLLAGTAMLAFALGLSIGKKQADAVTLAKIEGVVPICTMLADSHAQCIETVKSCIEERREFLSLSGSGGSDDSGDYDTQ